MNLSNRNIMMKSSLLAMLESSSAFRLWLAAFVFACALGTLTGCVHMDDDDDTPAKVEVEADED